MEVRRSAERWLRPRTEERGKRIGKARTDAAEEPARAARALPAAAPAQRGRADCLRHAPSHLPSKVQPLASAPRRGSLRCARSRPQRSARSIAPAISLGPGAGVAGGRSAKPKIRACCRRGTRRLPFGEALVGAGATKEIGGVGGPRAHSDTKQTRKWCSLCRRDARAVRWESGQNQPTTPGLGCLRPKQAAVRE